MRAPAGGRVGARVGGKRSTLSLTLPLSHIPTFVAFALALSVATAATFTEDFSSEPSARGWRSFGGSDLFTWNATNQNLEVTWDSARPNSYFHRPLGTVLARDDDFRLQFDLRLTSIQAGVNPEKPSTFELAIGFLRLGDATNAAFDRGTGRNSPNLVEFDYFPAADIIAATVWPAIVSTNGSFNYNGRADYAIRELPVNDLFHVAMSYTASNQTLITTMTRNGAPFGPAIAMRLNTNFTDFRVDALSISSYNDAGDAYGSLLAHGTVDNFVVTTPEPPVGALAVRWTNGVCRVEFASRASWLYTLERTVDFQNWFAVSPAQPGTGGPLVLEDLAAPAAPAPAARCYRVHAQRP